MELAAVVKPLDIHLPPLTPGEAVSIGIRKRPCLLAVSGVGPLNAAWAAGRILAMSSLAGVICVGIAGSFDTARFSLGSACLVTEAIWPEYGIVGESGVHAEALGFPQAEFDGKPVWDRLAWDAQADAQALGLDISGFPLAKELTVAGVTGSAGRAAAMVQRFQPDIETMEGFAWALACKGAGLPLVQVRSISNPVGERNKAAWDFPGALKALAEAGSKMFSGGAAANLMSGGSAPDDSRPPAGT